MALVQKSNFFLFGFFGIRKSEKMVFLIFWIEKKILNRKINVLKSAKR